MRSSSDVASSSVSASRRAGCQRSPSIRAATPTSSSNSVICSEASSIMVRKRIVRSSRSPVRVSVRAKPKIVAKGVRRSWQASETTRGNLSSVIVALRFYLMAETRNSPIADMQASAPEIQLGLTRAGVTGVQKAIRIRHDGREKTFAAEISCTVDLDPGQKGVHMSRFTESFGEAIDTVVIGEAFLVET